VSSDMSHTRMKKIRMPPRIAAAVDYPPLSYANEQFRSSGPKAVMRQS
jgi:hypothetical protein